MKSEHVPRPDDKKEAALRGIWSWDPATGERLPDLLPLPGGESFGSFHQHHLFLRFPKAADPDALSRPDRVEAAGRGK